MNKRNLWYLFLFFLVSVYASNAQEKLSVTVEDCINIGLKNSKSLHSSALNVDVAEVRYSSANESFYPSIKLGGTYTRLSDVPPYAIQMPAALGGGLMVLSPTILNNYSAKLSVTQPLFTGFALVNASNLSKNLFEASKEDLQKDKNEMVYKIKEAYWGLFRVMEIKKVIDENVSQMEAHLKDIKDFYAQGLVTNNQVLQVQVQLSNAKLNQIDAENNVRLTMINLNNLLELPLETEIQITSAITIKKTEQANLTSLIQKATDKRPELKSMEYKVKASEYNVGIANSAWYPQLALLGNYSYNKPNSRYMPVVNQFKDSWDVTVSLQWDVWNWGKTSDKVEEAKATLNQAEDGLNIMKNGVKMEVTSNYLTYLKTKESITVAEDGVKQAEENYKVTHEKFKNGMALNTDLIDSEVALLQSKINYTQSLVNYELVLARIQKSIGE